MTMFSTRVGDKLSPRQLTILQMVANGNQDKEIGDNLKISVQTVRNHLATARRKMGARDRAHAAALAVKYGLVTLEPSQRHIEILQMVANGLQDKQIGAHLGISCQTAKNHIIEARRKVDGRDRAHMVALAIKYGLIDLKNIEPDLSVNEDI